jgi:hypothetical protein
LIDGIKFIFTIIAISALSMCINIFFIINSVNNYLVNDEINYFSKNIDIILGQIPELEYHDGKVRSETPEHKYISIEDKEIILVDLKSQLKSTSESTILQMMQVSQQMSEH